MAKNQLYPEAKHIAVTADKAYKSGQPVKIGQLTGVAIIDAKAGEKVTVWLDGSWRLPVTGATTVGGKVNIDSNGALVATGGTPWGVALEALSDASTGAEVAPFGIIQA